MTEQVTDIQVRFSEDELFGYDPEALEDTDIAASKVNYINSVVNHLYDAYPNAEVAVAEGPRFAPVRVNGLSDHPEVEAVQQLLDVVWNGDSWLEGKEA